MKAMKKLVVALALVALISANGTSARLIEVGGSHGWDLSIDYDKWASTQNFSVGDTLVFKYPAVGLHSTVELSGEAAYNDCSTSGGSVSITMASGNDTVKLDKAGTRYFACSIPGHCEKGMKVKIVVGSSSSTNSSSSSPSPTPSPKTRSSSPPISASSPNKKSSGAASALSTAYGPVLMAAAALPIFYSLLY